MKHYEPTTSLETKVQMMIDKHVSASMIIAAVKQDLLNSKLDVIEHASKVIEQTQEVLSIGEQNQVIADLQNLLSTAAEALWQIKSLELQDVATDDIKQMFAFALNKLTELEKCYIDKVEQIVIDMFEMLFEVMHDDMNECKYNSALYQSISYSIRVILDIIDIDKHQYSAKCLQEMLDTIEPLTKIEPLTLKLANKLDKQ